MATNDLTGNEDLPPNDSVPAYMAEIASMNPAFRGVCFLHQIHAFPDVNKTSIDGSLNKHKEIGDILTFQTQLGLALMKNTDYLEELRRAERKDGRGNEYYSGLRKFSNLVKQFKKTSITHAELTNSHGFTSGKS